MPNEMFEDWYEQVRNAVCKYKDPETRTAFIVGWIRGIHPDTLMTAEQVARIFALRYPENG